MAGSFALGDGDDAVFAAALQFIDDWDCAEMVAVTQEMLDESDSTGSSSSSSSDDRASNQPAPSQAHSMATSGSSPSKPPATARRLRPTEQLQELRREEFELTGQLDLLRLSARQLASARGSRAKFWERAAGRQFEYRMLSEQENHRLKALVRAQIRKARYLRQLWLKRTAAAMESAGCEQNGKDAPTDNDEVFHRLLATIDEDYIASTQILDSRPKPQTNGQLAPDAGSIRVNAACGDEDDVFMENFIDTTAPFPLRVVEKALWLGLTQRRMQRNPSFRRDFVKVTDDLIRSSAYLELKYPGFQIALRVRLVARKYIEENRAVIVMKTQIDPMDVDGGNHVGLQCYETIVRVLTPAEPTADSSSSSSTRIETHSTLRRKVLDGPNAEFWRGGFDSDIAKMLWTHAHLSRNEAAENIMIEQSLHA